MALVMLREKINSLTGLATLICQMTLIGSSWVILISSGIPMTEINREEMLMKC
jgi:hypothetical protein